MAEPTDNEIMELAKPFITRVGSHWENGDAIPDNGRIEEFARAVLARWGAQPAPAGSVLEDAARYDWLFGARTDAQVSSEISTVFNPLPQDEVISHLQGFYMSKSEVNALIDAARKQGGA